MLSSIYEEEHQHNLKIYETNFGKQPTKGLIYMEFKVNFRIKTTTLHSGVVEKNKFMHFDEQAYKEMVGFLFMPISHLFTSTHFYP